jgi:HAE1 family hydrophobic/amphiphilic exporter-1
MGIAATIIPNLGVDLYPSTTMPVLTVFTSCPGASPVDVEQNVTMPLERALASIQGLVNMTSISSFQNSSITLQFNYGTNMDKAMTDAQTLVSRLGNSLHSDAGSPTVQRVDMSSTPLISLIIRGNYPPDQLRLFAENEIQSSIEKIAGVAAVEVTGGTTQLIQVAVSLNRLAAFDLTLSDVTNSLQEVLDSLDQIKRLVVKTVNINGAAGQPNRFQVIRLEDIADVSIAHNDNAERVYVNGETGIYIQVSSKGGSNQVQVSNNVRDALEEINNSLPQGITLELLSDNTTMTRSTLSQVYTYAIQGAILVMVLLFLFLRNIKGTLITGLAIPISILLTLMFMSIFGFTLNLLTMTGLIIAMGMTINGSIVVLENIHSYRERGVKSRIAAVLGSREMLRAIITSCASTLCVFILMIIYKNDLGYLGLMFGNLIFTVVIALVISLIVAITLVPCLCGSVFPINTRKQKPLKIWVLRYFDDTMEAIFRGLENGYKKTLNYCLSHRFIIILFVMILMALTVTQFTKMNMNLYSRSFTDDNININVSLPQGTVIDETEALLFKLEEIAKEEVKGYQNIILTSWPTGTMQGNIQITLPESAMQIDTPADIIAKLTPYLYLFPDAIISFSANRGIGTSSAVELAISSKNYNSIMETANEIVSIIKRYLPEIEDPVINIDEGAPQLEINLDRDRAAALGIPLSTIASEIRTAVDGTTATTVTIGGRLMNVNVGLRDADRIGMLNLDALFVMSQNGSRIPLASVASVVEGRSSSPIRRENQERVVRITGQLAPGIAATEMQRILKDTVKEHLVMREDLTVRYLGEAQEIASYYSIFLLIIAAAIILVFGIIASQFESFVDPLIIIFSVPLLLIGVVWLYKITGQTMTITSAVGIVALVGVVTNNGIILVDYTKTLRARGYKVREACLEAGRTRLRPILMTSLCAILSLVPIAFFPGMGTDNIRPIAQTFIGGLAVSSFMTLFLIPVLYSLFNNWRDREKTGITRH